MCGRFSVGFNLDILTDRFNVSSPSNPWKPRYNAAPGQELPVLLNTSADELSFLRWGLIPHWAKDASMSYSMINARAESIAQKPSFRRSFERHRCLVIADGFFEWKKVGKTKEPHYFQLASKEPFAFAGLWDIWVDSSGKPVQTFTIITTIPNELVAKVHDRMPVILSREEERKWLAYADLALLRPYPAEEMRSMIVSQRVNQTKNDSPDILQPVAKQTTLF